MAAHRRNPVLAPIWRWVLYSPKRLMLTVSAVLVSGFAISALTTPDHPADAPTPASPAANHYTTAPTWPTYSTSAPTTTTTTLPSAVTTPPRSPATTPSTTGAAPTTTTPEPPAPPAAPAAVPAPPPPAHSQPTSEQTLPPATAPGLDPPLP